MSNNRDNFPKRVTDSVSKRAAFICSNPDCRVLTIAPSVNDETKWEYVGKVAHITAAAPGGPRYEPTLTPELRRAASNALFLCSNCAARIDNNNGIDFPVDTLEEWKTNHEEWVSENLNKPTDTPQQQMQTVVISSRGQMGGITAHTVILASETPTAAKRNKSNLALTRVQLSIAPISRNDGSYDFVFVFRFAIETLSEFPVEDVTFGVISLTNGGTKSEELSDHLRQHLEIQKSEERRYRRATGVIHRRNSVAKIIPFATWAERIPGDQSIPIRVHDNWYTPYMWRAAAYIIAKDSPPIWYQLSIQITGELLKSIYETGSGGSVSLASRYGAIEIERLTEEPAVVAWEDI